MSSRRPSSLTGRSAAAICWFSCALRGPSPATSQVKSMPHCLIRVAVSSSRSKPFWGARRATVSRHGAAPKLASELEAQPDPASTPEPEPIPGPEPAPGPKPAPGPEAGSKLAVVPKSVSELAVPVQSERLRAGAGTTAISPAFRPNCLAFSSRSGLTVST